jgi:hypothetical protein
MFVVANKIGVTRINKNGFNVMLFDVTGIGFL